MSKSNILFSEVYVTSIKLKVGVTRRSVAGWKDIITKVIDDISNCSIKYNSNSKIIDITTHSNSATVSGRIIELLKILTNSYENIKFISGEETVVDVITTIKNNKVETKISNSKHELISDGGYKYIEE